MSEIDNNVPFNYYNVGRGWDETNRGWHVVTFEKNINPFKHLEMVEWLYKNVDNPERHARWIRLIQGSSFKFRYERDYLLFVLRWG